MGSPLSPAKTNFFMDCVQRTSYPLTPICRSYNRLWTTCLVYFHSFLKHINYIYSSFQFSWRRMDIFHFCVFLFLNYFVDHFYSVLTVNPSIFKNVFTFPTITIQKIDIIRTLILRVRTV